MKKLFTLMALALVCMVGFALPTSTILLQHKGKVTHYDADSIALAIREAVDNDTLFLTKGSYSGFTIDKQITVRGEGLETFVNGDIVISIPDSVTLKNTLLEGLQLCWNSDYENYADIRVSQSLNGMVIKQCAFSSISFYGIHSDVRIDRCRIGGELRIPNKDSNRVLSMTVNNSKIYSLYPQDVSSKNISFVNCNIQGSYYFWHSYISDFRGSFINSIVGSGSEQKPLKECSVIYSLIDEGFPLPSSTYTEHIYKEPDTNSNPLFSYWGMNCTFSDEELIEKGYLGNDGTVVGCNGGTTPFTLTLAVPTVESSEVSLDNDNHILNVNIKLKD